MNAQVILPRIMHVGNGATQQITDVLNTLGVSKPLLITDAMMVQLGYADLVSSALHVAGIEAEVFSDTIPEPTVASIQAGVKVVEQGGFDSIIAIGGGSPMDSAKAIAILGKFGGQMHDYKFPRNVTENGLPVIAIPTTAGTGSEVTRFTIITDETTDEKMLCVGVGFMPVAALIDYELTLSLPPRVTADCGLDALTHAIESYVSAKSNTFSDTQALAAMRLIGPNLLTVYQQPDNKQAREAMMLGSTLAGIAFSNASVALVHGMSRPIGAFFHVPHGLSNAMLLPAITAFSIPSAPERYAECARAIGFAESNDNDQLACNKLIAGLKQFNQQLNVPGPKAYGIDEARYHELLPTMAAQALASGSPANNPRIPTEDEMIALYQQVW